MRMMCKQKKIKEQVESIIYILECLVKSTDIGFEDIAKKCQYRADIIDGYY